MRPFTIVNISFAILLLGIDWLYLIGIADWWWLLLLVLLYVHVLVLGAVFIQWGFYIKSYNYRKETKYIALTFDDGPSELTVKLLDVLKAENVKATFFVVGKSIVANKEILKRCIDEGHVIGNHSYNHGFNFDWQSTRNMVEEIKKTNEQIYQISGLLPKLFRPPYGVTNPNLARAVKVTGMYSIGWNVRSFDTTAKDPKSLLERILNKLKGGDIILLHDTKQITTEILTDLIVKSRQKGYTFTSIDKLLDIKAYE